MESNTEIKIDNTRGMGTTKSERNRRKKANAKKIKEEARLKEEEENRLLKEMSALAVKKLEEEEARKQAEKLQATPGSDNGFTAKESLPFVPPGLLFKFDHSVDRGGIGSFALQDIQKGTEILVEEVIMKGTNEHIFKEALFSVLAEDKKRRTKALHSRCNCQATSCRETPLATVLEVNAYGAPSGPALYELASRFNHDCLPNIARGFSREEFMVFRAARDIKQGEELTVNYTMISGCRKTRHGYLLDKFDFLCKFYGCKNNLVYTVSDILKGELPEGVEPQSPAIGRYTTEEIAAYAEAEAWFKDVKEGMVDIQRGLYDHMARNAIAGDACVADSKSRDILAVHTLTLMTHHLKKNNKFGLESAVFDSFRSRNIQHMIEATEENFGLILESLEQSRRKGDLN